MRESRGLLVAWSPGRAGVAAGSTPEVVELGRVWSGVVGCGRVWLGVFGCGQVR